MDRKPIVAGQFYPGSKEQWEQEVLKFLGLGKQITQQQAILSMVPHAGYMFSGALAGRTLARANIADTVLLLGPNHTGQGASLALWPDGVWHLPDASLQIHEDLANEILSSHPNFQKDYSAHIYEHSLEVILPFLWVINPQTEILPISVSEPDLSTLIEMGENLAHILKNTSKSFSVVVSSDMSHFISQEQAKKKDNMALNAILELDPYKLYQTVRQNNITMCGILPMTMGLALAKTLGASKAELVDYSTSGEVIGDYQQVVGYAGILIW